MQPAPATIAPSDDWAIELSPEAECLRKMLNLLPPTLLGHTRAELIPELLL